MAKFKPTQLVRKEERQAENRGLSCWRTADTLEICSDTLLSDLQLKDDSFKVNKLFTNDSAQRAYLVFKKFDKVRYTESSILSIVRLDAIIAYIVDALQGPSKGSRTENSSQSAIPAVEEFDFSSFSTSAKKQKCRQRRDRKPREKIRSFKRYMPAAVCQPLRFCCYEYLYGCRSRGLDQDDLKFVCTDRTMGEQWSRFQNIFDNRFRSHTMTFCYPGSGHIYVPFTSCAFFDYIYDCIGVVSACMY